MHTKPLNRVFEEFLPCRIEVEFPQKIYFFNALNSKERLSQKWDLKSLLSYFNGETE